MPKIQEIHINLYVGLPLVARKTLGCLTNALGPNRYPYDFVDPLPIWWCS